jgi:hypothetical protein
MKWNIWCILALILGIVTSSFVNYKRGLKTNTYFFVYDATGQQIIYPQYPNYPPTTNPFTCNVPFNIRCVAEYSSYTINPNTWPMEFWPDGILLALYYKPMPL